MDRFRQMTLFMNIVEANSITKAADKLNLSKSVLSQHLKQLETELAITLLKRTTRRQILTPAGERFYKHCCQMHTLAEQAWNEALQVQNEPFGKLTITAPHALVDEVVVPAITSTFRAYKNVKLHVIADDKRLDLMQQNIDLAIRVGESSNSNYKQKKIGSFRDVLCQAKGTKTPFQEQSYIANHWQEKQIKHRFIDDFGDQKIVEYEAKHRTSSIYQTISMIESGLGVGIVPDFLLSSRAQLERVDVDLVTNHQYQLPPVNIYTLHPYHMAVPMAVAMAQESIESVLSTCCHSLERRY